MIKLGLDEIIQILSIYTAGIVFLLSAIVVPAFKHFLKKYIEDVEGRLKKIMDNYAILQTFLEKNYVKKESCELKHEPISTTIIRLQQDFDNIVNKIDRGFEKINNQLIEIIKHQKINGK